MGAFEYQETIPVTTGREWLIVLKLVTTGKVTAGREWSLWMELQFDVLNTRFKVKHFWNNFVVTKKLKFSLTSLRDSIEWNYSESHSFCHNGQHQLPAIHPSQKKGNNSRTASFQLNVPFVASKFRPRSWQNWYGTQEFRSFFVASRRNQLVRAFFGSSKLTFSLSLMGPCKHASWIWLPKSNVFGHFHEKQQSQENVNEHLPSTWFEECSCFFKFRFSVFNSVCSTVTVV